MRIRFVLWQQWFVSSFIVQQLLLQKCGTIFLFVNGQSDYVCPEKDIPPGPSNVVCYDDSGIDKCTELVRAGNCLVIASTRSCPSKFFCAKYDNTTTPNSVNTTEEYPSNNSSTTDGRVANVTQSTNNVSITTKTIYLRKHEKRNIFNLFRTYDDYNNNSQQVDEQETITTCPAFTEQCMNQTNYLECRKFLYITKCQNIQIMNGTCPYVFQCLDNDATTLEENDKQQQQQRQFDKDFGPYQCPNRTDSCMNDDNYNQCQGLISICGNQIQVMESCPLQFACPENDDENEDEYEGEDEDGDEDEEDDNDEDEEEDDNDNEHDNDYDNDDDDEIPPPFDSCATIYVYDNDSCSGQPIQEIQFPTWSKPTNKCFPSETTSYPDASSSTTSSISNQYCDSETSTLYETIYYNTTQCNKYNNSTNTRLRSYISQWCSNSSINRRKSWLINAKNWFCRRFLSLVSQREDEDDDEDDVVVQNRTITTTNCTDRMKLKEPCSYSNATTTSSTMNTTTTPLVCENAVRTVVGVRQ